ncbi:MAG: aminodeoxychorismate synthase component I [Bacteroidales bacterium]|nr:aminodeoxychorismate synthase component I [Bacteroidales bacterium]MDT8432522.1 aminodeoxychorismate synthase component I [Bacteroidales bacterium]
MDRSGFVHRCNQWAVSGTPFLFVIDFEMTRFHIIRLGDAAEAQVFFKVGALSNAAGATWQQLEQPGMDPPPAGFRFELSPVSYDRYARAFSLVRENILHGNSFLLNLTFPTQLDTDLTLEQVFQRSNAPYKLLFKNRFVLFSPETFIRIRDGFIFSYPMKGTIDAAIPQAEKTIMNNDKELWEHNTIVDLIRNDLSMVAHDVEVTKYRYIDRLRTNRNELLQVSSEIRGRLDRGWQGRLGEILLQLLPAGSISGAPKKKTLEIIAQAEGEKRGYFTGIFGIFDGVTLDSGVMIRYIEQNGGGLQFRSGGGITGHSEAQKEYNEMIDKVYVPFI